MKKCSKCKELKNLNEFSKDNSRKDGLQPSCKKCFSEYRIKNIEKIRAQKRLYSESNKELIALDQKFRYENNKKNRLTYAKNHGAVYKKENKDKVAQSKKKWRLSNPGLYAAYCAKRRAQKIKATPSWLNSNQWDQINLYYKQAATLTKETGIPHEVDHIIPLQGEEVSGLHVPWNLQILTEDENKSKNNKII